MLWILFKIRMKALFSGQNSKKNKRRSPALTIGLLSVLGVYMLGLFGFMCYGLASVLFESNLYWIYFAMVAFLSVFLCFIGSVFSIQSQVFAAKDNELLLSMPIRPRDIMLSRLLALMALNFIYSALVMIPALVVWIMLGKVTVVSMILFILGNILLPMFTMAFSCFIVWIVSLLTARMKHKNIFTTVFMLAAFVGYMYLCGNMGVFITEIGEKAESVGGFITTFLLPIRFFAYASDPLALTGTAFLNFLYLILISVIPLVIVLSLLSKFFIGIATTKRGSPQNVYKRTKLTASSSRLALYKKEFSYFLSLPMYILNCALGALFVLIIGIFLIIKQGDLSGLFAQLGPYSDIIPLALCVMMGFCASMTDITAPSISLEGKTLWILQSCPINPMDVFIGKIGVNLTIGFSPIIITSVIALFILDLSIPVFLLMMFSALLFQYLFAVGGLYINILIPKFDWLNETVAIKQSTSTLIAMFGGFLVVGIPIILFFATSLFAGLSITACLGCLLGYVLILSAAVTALITTHGKRKFVELTN